MSQEEKQTKLEELTVPVAGMTCAACVMTIEKALRGLRGVKDASVSLAGGKAAVRVDPGACTLPHLERAIGGVGYEGPWARLGLLVLGMMRAHCEGHISKALNALPGPISARAPPPTLCAAEVARTEPTPGSAFSATEMFSSQWAPIIPRTSSSRRAQGTS